MPPRIPFVTLPASEPRIAREYQKQIARVMRRGRFILGEEVRKFEEEFAAFCGARFCIAVGNGTEALLIAQRLSGIRPGKGQEVITTPLTASFTAHAIVAAGAKPVFADVDPATLLLDPESVRERITSRTAAIIPVHLYGQVCNLNAFRAIARDRGCALLQDAAQAHGSEFENRPLSDFSGWVTFSFYPTKNLGALGDGGAIIANRRSFAEQARSFRDGGRRTSHVAEMEGINSRLDELQAALLRVNLRHLKAWNRRRAALAQRYDRLLRNASPENVRVLDAARGSRSSHHLYVIRVRRRDALQKFLAVRGIETGIHYQQPLHLQPAFRSLGYKRGDFPHAEAAAQQVLSLPLHPFLKQQEADRVAEEVARFFRS